MAAAPDLPEWALGWDAEVAEDDAREAAVSDNTSLPVLAIDIIVKPPEGPQGSLSGAQGAEALPGSLACKQKRRFQIVNLIQGKTGQSYP